MKANIHPNYVETQVTCTCGNTFTTRSTSPNGVLRADVCSACHPFYTGKQKILDTGGRVARFQKRPRAFYKHTNRLTPRIIQGRGCPLDGSIFGVLCGF
jgi:large subunit ribosomal protein L31